MNVIGLVIDGLGIHAAFKVKNLNVLELNRMALALQLYGPPCQHFSWKPKLDFLTIHISATHLGLLVRQDFHAVGKMLHYRITQDQDFGPDPLVSMVSFRG